MSAIAEMPDVEKPERESAAVWLLAAVGAIVLHVGCVAFALGHIQYDDPQEALGARAIEIGIELAAPRLEPTDLAPGPNVEASAASPEIVEQKAVVKETDLPTAMPTETDDPDRLVTPNPSQKPVKDEVEVETAQAAPSSASIAVEATAMPTMETARETERSTAPAQGTGESALRIRTTWQKELLAHFDHHKRYPSDRSARSAEVSVSFAIDRAGHILSSAIVKGSGDASFDAAALEMLRRSDPVPPPPPLVADEGLDFSLPVIFRVKGSH